MAYPAFSTAAKSPGGCSLSTVAEAGRIRQDWLRGVVGSGGGWSGLISTGYRYRLFLRVFYPVPREFPEAFRAVPSAACSPPWHRTIGNYLAHYEIHVPPLHSDRRNQGS